MEKKIRQMLEKYQTTKRQLETNLYRLEELDLNTEPAEQDLNRVNEVIEDLTRILEG